MTKRQLTQTERNIVGKRMVELKKEVEHLNYLMEYNNLMIEKGLWQNYLEKKEEFKGIRQQLHSDILLNYEKLRMLQEHLDKGVEEKDKDIPLGVN